jgi:hypothetical protein
MRPDSENPVKIAYLFLVHNNPRVLQRSVRALKSPGAAFFAHVDRKSSMEDFSALSDGSIHFCANRIAVYWGEFSLVEAILELIRLALAHPSHYDYFALLSGSDYPLRSGRHIHDFLSRNRGIEFMNLAKMPAPGFPLEKINKVRYSSESPVRRFATRALAKFGLARRDYRKHLRGLDPYCGSTWWTLSRDAVVHAANFVAANPWFVDFFRKTFTSDEMFFHTILGNSEFRSQIRRNLVYLDWPTGNHPSMLDESHVEMFEAQTQVMVEDEWGSGEALFARKFCDDKLDLIDRIDAMIEKKDELPGNLPLVCAGEPELEPFTN